MTPQDESQATEPTSTLDGDPDKPQPDGDQDEQHAAARSPDRSSILSFWVVGLCLAASVASVLQIATRVQRGFLLLVLVGVFAIIAALLDVAHRRIPNTLTYPAILIGLVVNLTSGLLAWVGLDIVNRWTGAVSPADGLLGFGVCAAIGMIGFAFRGIGGGDAKLLGALGALLGFKLVWPVLFNTLFVAAIVALVNYISRGRLLARLQMIATTVLLTVLTRRPVPLVGF